MAISLLKTAQNVSGTYTPNLLLYGYFQLTLTGNATINIPSALTASDGQLFSVDLLWVGSGAALTYTVNWNGNYLIPNDGPQLSPGNPLIACRAKHIFMYDDGKAYLFYGQTFV